MESEQWRRLAPHEGEIDFDGLGVFASGVAFWGVIAIISVVGWLWHTTS